MSVHREPAYQAFDVPSFTWARYAARTACTADATACAAILQWQLARGDDGSVDDGA